MQWAWNSGRASCALLLLLAAAGASAEDVDASPGVSLDQLLHVPVDVEVEHSGAPRYGGATRDEWRARFEEVRAERAEAQEALDAAKEELGGVAAETSQWQMTAPGMGGAQSATSEKGPLNYRLRQEIRRQREEIERADKRLQELRVQANLAGVPDEWIAEEATADAATAGVDAAPVSGVDVDPAAGPR